MGYEKVAEIFLDEETPFEVYATELYDNPEGWDVTIIYFMAFPKGTRYSQEPIQLIAGMVRSLHANTSFNGRNDIREIVLSLGLARLKSALKENQSPRKLPDHLLSTRNWADFIEFRDSGFSIKDSESHNYNERQIAKRRVIRELRDSPGHLLYSELLKRLALDEATLRRVLSQLREAGFVIQEADEWCLSDKGERSCSRTALKAMFPLDNEVEPSDRDVQPSEVAFAPDFQKGATVWDAFICHASEDKVEVASPLAQHLREMGLKVWIDESTIKIGDSLPRKIDEGLAACRFGVVILSPSFFKKNWTKTELDALVTREASGDGNKLILPVWHSIGRDEVARHSPILASKFAGSTQGGIRELAEKLKDAMS